MEQSVTLLKKHGLKATPQRIAIYDYLLHTEAPSMRHCILHILP